MMEALQASEGRVDLWYTYQDLAIDSRLLETYAGLLSEDESVRWRRFLFERDRRRFLIARAMLRDVVSSYVGCEPCALAFEYNPYGKPALASPPGQSIRFNLSHSAGLAVCAVTRGHDVGVDVESPERRTDVLGLARRFFAESEVAALGRCPPEEQRRTFFEYWTLKEAYIKACGRGLSIPLDAFGFTLRADRPPTIGFAVGMADDPGDWQFAQVFLGQDYPIGLALRSCREEEMTVGIRRIIPLQRAGDAAVLPCNGLRRWTLESEFPERS